MTDPLESLAFPAHDLVAPMAPSSPATAEEEDSYWQHLWKGRDMSSPRPGDKVRVTYEGVVNDNGKTFCDTADYWRAFEGAANIEVIEPADDPSKDPIGTVRERTTTMTDGTRTLAVKIRGNCWFVLMNNKAFPVAWSDHEVTGWPKQPLAEVARVFSHPEPEAPKLRAFKDSEDDLWFEIVPGRFSCSTERQWAVEDYEKHTLYSRWTLKDLRSKFGPLTEVTE